MKGTGKSVKKRKKDSDFKKNVVFNLDYSRRSRESG